MFGSNSTPPQEKQPVAMWHFTRHSTENEQLRDVTRTKNFVMAFAAAGAGLLLIYSSQFLWPAHSPVTDALSLFGAGGLLALAALMVGALAGFVFGIPRSLRDRQVPSAQQKVPATPAAQSSVIGASASASVSTMAASPSSSSQFQSNTNLEEISDWLTKIIVGLGLTKLAQIPGYVKRLTGFVTDLSRVPELTGTIAFMLMASFGICGFFMGYLMTRLFLQRAFDDALAPGAKFNAELSAAAQDPVSLNAVPDTSITDTGIKRAMAVQNASSDISPNAVRERIRNLAQGYETLRLAMSPGHDRTNSLEQVASQMKSLGLTAQPFLGELKVSASAGERLAAVTALEITPRVDSLEWLADRIVEERPFIGYHAALALRAAVRAFPPSFQTLEGPASIDADPAQAKICRAIAKAMKYLDDNELHQTDRYDVLAVAKSEGKCQ